MARRCFKVYYIRKEMLIDRVMEIWGIRTVTEAMEMVEIFVGEYGKI